MSFDGLDLALPEERDLTLPSPFKRILSKTSELEVADDNYSQSLYYEQIKRIKIMEYELSSLKNQAMLDKLDHDKEVAGYQRELKLKDEEISVLSSNEKFLFEQNQELKNELSLVKTSNSKGLAKKDEEIYKLRKSVALKQDSLTELRYELESQSSKSKILESESAMKIEQLESHLKDLENSLDDQIHQNNKSLEKIHDLEDQIENLRSSRTTVAVDTDGNTELLYKKQFNTQVEHIAELQDKINAYEKSLNKLSKSNELVEVLKEERNSFVKRLENSKAVEGKYDELKLKYQILKQELQKWNDLNKDAESPHEFINTIKLTIEENKALKEKTIKLSVDLSNLLEQNTQLQQQVDDVKLENDELKSSLQKLRQTILKTLNHKRLLEQELTFTKNQIDFFTTENQLLLASRNRRLSAGAETEGDSDTTVILKNKQKVIDDLNMLVSQYKNELDSSIQNLQSGLSPISGEKRRKLDDLKSHFQKDHIQELTSLNLELEAKERTISLLKNNLDSANKELDVLKKSISLQKSNRSDSSQSDLLQKENEQLLSELQNKEDFDSIPKTVYDRLLLEQRSFQDKLFESNKKQARLKEAFEKQIARYSQIILNLFGYRVEFISASRLKLTSSKFDNGEFLMVDASDNQKGVDVQIDTANYRIEQLKGPVFENLIQYWLIDKKDNSCFLSALTMELFDRRSSTIS